MRGCLSCKLASNSANPINNALVDFAAFCLSAFPISHFAYSGGTADFNSRWCSAAEPSEDAHINSHATSRHTIHRRVDTSCDLEDVPRAGDVSFSVADAKKG